MKQEFQLVTYAAAPVQSMEDKSMQQDKATVCSVKVIPNEECAPKHKLSVMDMSFNTTKRWHMQFEP